jgi:hypothetical protein
MKGDNIVSAMITTVDNPHDPRIDFPSWYAWDTENGYNTCAYLARIALVSPDLPEPVTDQEIEDAIDEIIKIHAGGMYMKLPLLEVA